MLRQIGDFKLIFLLLIAGSIFRFFVILLIIVNTDFLLVITQTETWTEKRLRGNLLRAEFESS